MGEVVCQAPGNAICYLPEFDIIVGDPCCANSACLPYPFGYPAEPDNFCQFIARIAQGGDCSDRKGVCAEGSRCDGLTCIAETDCAMTGATCFEPGTDSIGCCLASDSCMPAHDDASPYKFTCQNSCALPGEDCYATGVRKGCCEADQACKLLGDFSYKCSPVIG